MLARASGRSFTQRRGQRQLVFDGSSIALTSATDCATASFQTAEAIVETDSTAAVRRATRSSFTALSLGVRDSHRVFKSAFSVDMDCGRGRDARRSLGKGTSSESRCPALTARQIDDALALARNSASSVAISDVRLLPPLRVPVCLRTRRKKTCITLAG
jgi:hypothetical protein